MKRQSSALVLQAVLFLSWGAAAAPAPAAPWKFAVSGDSRNCGDVVMPAIAAGATSSGAAFYWHLGDFRALSDVDEDILAQRRVSGAGKLSISDYFKLAWDDFLQNQIAPFGAMPIYLSVGNHELVAPKTRGEYLAQFADWLNAPPVQAQRLKDNPKDRRLKSYYHWIQNAVDFVTLDNASNDQFDSEQVAWLEKLAAGDAADPAITTIVAGMHAALPDSLSFDHSMSDWAQGEKSGHRVYAALLNAQAAGKKVYVLASHQHFYMSGIFDTPYWKSHGGILPGWIVGTAGAVRYPLPPGVAATKEARPNTYGYLLGTVDGDGSIRFDFQEVKQTDVPEAAARLFPPDFVSWCFTENIQKKKE